MEYLIKQNVPMRTAHGAVGQLVALCDSKQCRLAELSLEEFQQICSDVDESVFDVLGAENAVAALCSYGSGGLQPVSNQLDTWRKKLAIQK